MIVAIWQAVSARSSAGSAREQVTLMRDANRLAERQVTLEETRHQQEVARREAEARAAKAADLRVTGPWVFGTIGMSKWAVANKGRHDAVETIVEVVAMTHAPEVPDWHIDRVLGGDTPKRVEKVGLVEAGDDEAVWVQEIARRYYPVEILLSWTDGNGLHQERRQVIYGEH